MKEQEKIKILEQIDLYIRGKLSQDEIDELWKTFLKHPEYYDWFETEVHLRDLIREGKKPGFNSSGEESGNVSKKYGFKGWLYAAAAAVVLALGLQFFSLQHQDSLPSLAEAEINQTELMGADVLRSNTETDDDLNVAINNALATAYEGETEEAIEEFKEILNESLSDEQRGRVEMNLGILYYNDGRFETARDYFQSVALKENLPDYVLEKAWWFLGNTYLNIEELRNAREAVFNAYSLNGKYQTAALALLKKLDRRLGNIPKEEAPERLGG